MYSLVLCEVSKLCNCRANVNYKLNDFQGTFYTMIKVILGYTIPSQKSFPLLRKGQHHLPSCVQLWQNYSAALIVIDFLHCQDNKDKENTTRLNPPSLTSPDNPNNKPVWERQGRAGRTSLKLYPFVS